MSSRINYSNYKSYSLTCPDCGWDGLGKDTSSNYGGMVMDLECPECFKMLAVIDFPSYSETILSGSEADRQAALKEANIREKYRLSRLKSPNQLPEIKGSGISFIFKSGTVEGQDLNIIEHKGQEVWREPIVWEGYERFMEVGRILKEKYGKRMADLVPDKTAEMYLYGDKLKAPAILNDFRKQLKKYPPR